MNNMFNRKPYPFNYGTNISPDILSAKITFQMCSVHKKGELYGNVFVGPLKKFQEKKDD